MNTFASATIISFYGMYAIVDVETTGGSAKTDRIAEIAIYRYDGERIVDSFVSLINPEVKMPPFVSKLTGITNAMLEKAPRFADVAERIAQITHDAVFVAHNVDFDYAYVRSEFKRLGHVFERRRLCTVNLSRHILPGFQSYSLGNLCRDLQIPLHDRHRAGGDALATTYLFELLLKSDKEQVIQQHLDKSNLYKLLPPGLPPQTVEHLPEETGVFYFHDQSGKVIFVGKSADMKRRILLYLQPAAGSKGKHQKMVQKTHHISYQETGSELIAQLLELYEISKLKPAYNRESATRKHRFGIYKYSNTGGYWCLQVKKLTKAMPLIGFAKEEYALKSLRKKAEEFALCTRLCGFEPDGQDTTAECTGYLLKICKGACIGAEKTTTYNERVKKAVSEWDLPADNFFILGEGRTNTEKSVVQIEGARFVGFGFYEPEFVQSTADIKNCIKPIAIANQTEAMKLVKAYLKNNRIDKIVRYQNT